MSNKIVLRQAASMNRRQPLLHRRSPSMGEVIGGTTAECVAVCCCFPCGLANFLLLAIYKVPAGLCRRALRKRSRSKMIKEELLQPTRRRHCSCGCCDDVNGLGIFPMCANDASDITRLYSSEPDKDVMALEQEMLERFFSTGFWRSSSRRESPNTSSSSSYSNLVVLPPSQSHSSI